MIIIMKPGASEEAIRNVTKTIEAKGLQAHLSHGAEVTIVGVIGDKTKLHGSNIEIAEGVDKVVNVTESYKLVNKKFHPEDSSIPVGNTVIGPATFTVMAGPCAIEDRDMLLKTAEAVKAAGAAFLRGGAYKPRTSPYSFQGLEEEGLKYMKEAREATGLNIICEVTSLRALETAVKYVDMLQIGARNMQNFELLKEVGKSGVPVLLKRGLSATVDEWLNAAEYIISEGNPNIVLCERGIRTYETATRNTLDLSAVPVIRAKSHLPIIVDPSHATGVRAYVEPLSRAAAAVGADGLMVEVHPCPPRAMSDGPQSLTFEQFDAMMRGLQPYIRLAGRSAAGCSAAGNSADGRGADGCSADGHGTTGNSADGRHANGCSADGHGTTGNSADGHDTASAAGHAGAVSATHGEVPKRHE